MNTGTWFSRAAPVSRLNPALVWPVLLAMALWPHWQWTVARLRDGSDDPLGIAALAVLVWMVGRQSRPQPVRLPWLGVATGLTLLATAGLWRLPPLLGAILAALAMAAGLVSVRTRTQAVLPVAGLAVLSLPVVSSLQFYAGFPLRIVAAQGSVWLLQMLGFSAERTGAAMTVNGHLVLVDAPCSGVQMVWMAYFAALTLSLLHARSDRFLLRRLPLVGLLVMAGNILRNTLLVGLEASGVAISESMHQGIGLAVLALVLLGVIGLIGGRHHVQGS